VSSKSTCSKRRPASWESGSSKAQLPDISGKGVSGE
jgi:hypothetical protein